MKKVGALLVLFLLLFSVATVFAEDNESAEDEETGTTVESTGQQQDSSKIEDGFVCLEEEAGDCSDLTTKEVALTILATPENIFDDCVEELLDRESSNNWGNVKDTALAVLALDHAGKDTEDYEEWILEQEEIPEELIWYMQQDSNEDTECHIAYDSNDYSIKINQNKKIDSSAGDCLTKAQSDFWLQVSNDCFGETFFMECDKDFIANFLYRNKRSSTIYVLEGTQSSPAYGSIELRVQSKCFGSGSCDYEATAWATLALLKTGHNVEDFIPYVIAMSDTNEMYLPDAFVYMLTNYDDYATKLITEQKLGNYWEAKSSAYNRYYDTSLALIALGSSSSEQIVNARDWLLFSQGDNGCWQNSVQDTAISLWALAGRSGRPHNGDSSGSVTYCSQADFFCIPQSDCPSNEDVGDNYFCASLSDTCCTSENLQTCSQYGGSECAEEEVCTGNERKAVDTNTCCTGACKERPQETECEANFYTCMDECSDYQESVSAYSCDGSEVCCKTKDVEDNEGSSWTWLIIVLIIIVIAAAAYYYREKLKLLLFKLKTRFKKDKKGDKGENKNLPRGPGGMPPRPGFPPVRRARGPMPPPQRRPHPRPQAHPRPQPQRGRSYDRRDPAMSDTFKKLREMSG